MKEREKEKEKIRRCICLLGEWWSTEVQSMWLFLVLLMQTDSKRDALVQEAGKKSLPSNLEIKRSDFHSLPSTHSQVFFLSPPRISARFLFSCVYVVSCAPTAGLWRKGNERRKKWEARIRRWKQMYQRRWMNLLFFSFFIIPSLISPLLSLFIPAQTNVMEKMCLLHDEMRIRNLIIFGKSFFCRTFFSLWNHLTKGETKGKKRCRNLESEDQWRVWKQKTVQKHSEWVGRGNEKFFTWFWIFFFLQNHLLGSEGGWWNE